MSYRSNEVAMVKTKKPTEEPFAPLFDPSFLQHHAGAITVEPRTAVVELIANAWDAGADRVDVTWPTTPGETIAVADNGAGMTKEEFRTRWRWLNYSRRDHQGNLAEVPAGKSPTKRPAFGRNGVGRHAMFCFAEEYVVDTRKEGLRSHFRVLRSGTTAEAPFMVEPLGQEPATGPSGTTISAISTGSSLDADDIRELIGSCFFADPDFSVFVNSHKVSLTDLKALISESWPVPVDPHGTLSIRRLDLEKSSAAGKHSGIAWWVNGRLVGYPTWDGHGGPLLDGRTSVAKRYAYIVEADMLEQDVKSDWSGFRGGTRVNEVRRAASEFLANDIRGLTSESRRAKKKGRSSGFRRSTGG